MINIIRMTERARLTLDNAVYPEIELRLLCCWGEDFISWFTNVINSALENALKIPL